MARPLLFITHPNVVIDAAVPVPDWPLSAIGRARLRQSLSQPWISEISALYCSTERKAIDSAEILAAHLALPFQSVAELGENDRSSTGFLSPDEFERVADQFFAHPTQSVRGWETADRAQSRIVTAVSKIARSDSTTGVIAIISHGAVGALLHCHLTGNPISRHWDQPANGGGNCFRFQFEPTPGATAWNPIDLIADGRSVDLSV